MTPTCWVIGTVTLIVSQRETFPRAAVLAAFGAFGGLVLWLTYRAASRRSDGLASFFLGMIVVTGPRQHGSLRCELASYVFPLLLMALMHLALGLYLRERRKPDPPPNSDPDLS
jgi:hypothetical protein